MIFGLKPPKYIMDVTGGLLLIKLSFYPYNTTNPQTMKELTHSYFPSLTQRHPYVHEQDPDGVFVIETKPKNM